MISGLKPALWICHQKRDHHRIIIDCHPFISFSTPCAALLNTEPPTSRACQFYARLLDSKLQSLRTLRQHTKRAAESVSCVVFLGLLQCQSAQNTFHYSIEKIFQRLTFRTMALAAHPKSAIFTNRSSDTSPHQTNGMISELP